MLLNQQNRTISGSTPLDLFKFYVKDLRDKLPSEKKLVKDLLKDKDVQIEAESKFDQFLNDIDDVKVTLKILNTNLKKIHLE